MGSFAELVLAASMPVLKFFLTSAIGLFLALKRIDILGETARHHLNQVGYFVFGPALVGSYLAKTITFKSFVSMWFMPINILLTFVLGSVMGWVLGRVTRAPNQMKGLIVSSCSAGNLGAMPLIIVPAICKQKGSPLGAPDVCKQYGLAYGSLSMALGSIYIWLYIYNIVRISTNNEVVSSDASANRVNKESEGLTLVSIRETIIPPASDCPLEVFVDQEPTSPKESEVKEGNVAEYPPVDQSSAAFRERFSSSSKSISIPLSMKLCLQNTSGKINLQAILAPSTIGAAVGFLIGMIPPLRELFFSINAPLHIVSDTAFMIGDAALPSTTLIVGANLLKGLKGSKVKFPILAGILAVRYIFLPLLGVLIVKGAAHAGFVQSHDPLFQFVLLLQYALPPALAIGTITQLFGASQSECSVIMLGTYAAAPVTCTLWTTFYLWLVSA